MCPLKLVINKRSTEDKDTSASPKAEKVVSRHIIIDKVIFTTALIMHPKAKSEE